MKNNMEQCCEHCGSTENLVKHHVSYVPEQIKILCRECHKKVHVKRGAFNRPPDFNYNEGKSIPGKTRYDLAVSMTPKLLTRINEHLEQLGENGRSAWVRSAIISKMNGEIEALREPEERVY